MAADPKRMRLIDPIGGLMAIFMFSVIFGLPFLVNFFELDMPRVLMRPMIMRFGVQQRAKITGRRASPERYRYRSFRSMRMIPPDEYFFSIEFEPRAGWAHVDEVGIGKEGYDVPGTETAVHFLSPFSSWVVLDDDHGYARGRAWFFASWNAGLAFFSLVVFYLTMRFGRNRLSKF